MSGDQEEHIRYFFNEWRAALDRILAEQKRRRAEEAACVSVLEALGDSRAIDLVDIPKLCEKVYGIPPSAWVDYDPPTPYTHEANPEPSE